MKKTFLLILACIFVLSSAMGCAGPAPEAVAEPEASPATKTVETPVTDYDPNEEEYYIIDSNTDVADAFDTVWWNATDLCRLMLFDRLIQCDPKGNPNIPQLAESFKTSGDGLINTFVLRTDVKWHDGEAFTADDVVWSIEAALKASKLASVIQTQLQNIKGAGEFVAGTADSVTGVTIADNVVTIELVNPSNMFLEAISQFAPLPKHLLEGEDPATIHTSEFWQAPIGNGAYKFDTFVVGEYFTFVRNDDYYGNKAMIKHVKSLIINATDYVVKTQANELDYIQTRDATTIEEILLNKNYTGNVFPVVYSRQFSFNTMGYNGATDGSTRVADIRIRQALNYALDIPAICEAIYGDYATPLYTYIAPNISGYTDDVEKYDYDPEKAKALLTEANFDFSQPIRILEYWGDPTTYDLLDLVVWYFDQIGVKAEYFNAGADATAAINEVRDYDINLNAYNCGASRNMAYSILTNTKTIRPDEETDFDTLYKELCAAPTFEAQNEIFKKLQQTEAKYCFTIPLCTLKYFAIINTAKVNTQGVNFLGDGFNYDRGFDKLSFNAEYFN